jgi:hypothetical protein
VKRRRGDVKVNIFLILVLIALVVTLFNISSQRKKPAGNHPTVQLMRKKLTRRNRRRSLTPRFRKVNPREKPSFNLIPP